MGRNLGPLNIKDSYEGLVQISGSQLTDGSGSLIASLDVTNITGSLLGNATTATSASHALVADSAGSSTTAVSASHALVADSAISALTATSASHALVADTALNVPSINTGSLMETGSVSLNTLTFTKADGSTFDLTVDTGSVSFDTGSLITTASISDATVTFTKGDATTFDLTVNNVVNATSASYAVVADSATSATTATSASHAIIADSALSANTATSASHAGNADAAITATTATSASHAVNADSAVSASYVLGSNVDGQVASALSSSYALTASFAENVTPTFPYTGDAVISGSLNISSSITANNVLTNQTDTYASTPKAHEVVTLTSAEYDGIGSKDPNTLYFLSDATGSIAVSASYAISSSYAANSDFATTASYALTAQSSNTATVALTASYVAGANVDGAVASATSASYAVSSSEAEHAVSASHALVADSLAGSIPVFPYTGSVNIIESTGEFSNNTNVIFAGVNPDVVSPGFTGSNNIDTYVFGVTSSYSGATAENYKVTNNSQMFIAGASRGQYNPIQIVGASGSAVIASGGTASGVKFGTDGSNTYPPIASAMIASQGNMLGGMLNSAMIGTYQSQMYGAGNYGVGMTIVGGANHYINRNYASGIFGGNANQMPNTFNDSLYMVGGQNNYLYGNGNEIYGGIGTYIMGGGYNKSIFSRGGQIGSGADTTAIFGGWGNQLLSGHTDFIFGGTNNTFTNRNTNQNASNVIVGGSGNTIESNNMDRNSILGGGFNSISGSIGHSAIIGSSGSLVYHDRSVVLGGSFYTSSAADQVTAPQMVLSGSITHAGGMLTMEPWATLPAASSYANSFAVSGSTPFFSDGTSWTALF